MHEIRGKTVRQMSEALPSGPSQKPCQCSTLQLKGHAPRVSTMAFGNRGCSLPYLHLSATQASTCVTWTQVLICLCRTRTLAVSPVKFVVFAPPPAACCCSALVVEVVKCTAASAVWGCSHR